MNVLFDISVLGRGHRDLRARAGIFRVVENLAMGLAASGASELAFSAMESKEALRASLDYLRSHARLRKVKLPFSRLQRLLDGADPEALERRIDASIYPLRAVLRAQRKFFHLARDRSHDAPHPMDPRALKRANVFHSPFFAFPESVRRAPHLRRFLTIHDVIPLLHPELFAFDAQGALRESLEMLQREDWVFCDSHSTMRDLCNALPTVDESRIFVVHLAAADTFRPCRDAERRAAVRREHGVPEEPYLLSLSTLEPRKNLDHLIRCFASLVEAERIHDLNLVLVGTRGWQYEQIFDAAGVANSMRERIFFTGFVADEDLAALYSGALAFVYPSFYEGFGLPPLEAMQCGVPVIVSNTSSLPEVVGEAGIMVDPRDSDALCQRMLEVYESESLREALAARSLERASQFSWAKCTQETLRAYGTSLGR